MFKAIILVSVSVAAAFSNVKVQLESEVSVFSSPNWLNDGPLLDTDVVSAIFVLKRDPAVVKAFEEQLLDLSTPSSKNYGKWLSKEQVVSQLAPAESNLKMVLDFLASYQSSGVTARVSDFRDKVFAHIPASVANQMLNTEFARFRSVEQRDIVLMRVVKPYSLPEDVASSVSLVDDIVRFPSIRRSRLTYGSEEDKFSNVTADPFSSCGLKCNGYTTPAVLQQRYGYPTLSKATKGNSVAVAEFQNQYYDDTDLTGFASACGVKVSLDNVIGGNNPSICKIGCTESLLDIEYIGAIVYPIPLTTIYSSSYSLLTWVDSIMSATSPILVHSVSYGNDEVQQTSAAYMEQCNTQFMAAGAMGLSILFASGDQGVWGRSGVGKTFNPDFPAASPYITAVGGTDFATKSTVGAETAWSCGGGGFSDEFATPSWQAAAVASYLAAGNAKNVLPASTLYNAKGRGYPDVSALAGQVNPYCVAVKTGSFGGVAGTSAACPVVAGIFAQLNDVRLAAGLSSLGWLNPFIYSNGDCFNDVADGSQNNCNAGTTGFSALSGWDPATGFGTPIYSCLAKAVLA